MTPQEEADFNEACDDAKAGILMAVHMMRADGTSGDAICIGLSDALLTMLEKAPLGTRMALSRHVAQVFTAFSFKVGASLSGHRPEGG